MKDFNVFYLHNMFECNCLRTWQQFNFKSEFFHANTFHFDIRLAEVSATPLIIIVLNITTIHRTQCTHASEPFIWSITNLATFLSSFERHNLYILTMLRYYCLAIQISWELYLCVLDLRYVVKVSYARRTMIPSGYPITVSFLACTFYNYKIFIVTTTLSPEFNVHEFNK